MKKFTVHHNLYATIDIQVIADSKEEAIRKAREVCISPDDYDFTPNEESVIDEEAVPDIVELKQQAEYIMQKAQEEGICFTLNPWLPATTQVWNGDAMIPRTELIESIYWDDLHEEICMDLDRGAEVTLSDITEVQQLELCQAIINQALDNGIQI